MALNVTPSYLSFSIFHKDAPTPTKAAKAAAAVADSVLGELYPLLMVRGLSFPYLPAPRWVGGGFPCPVQFVRRMKTLG